MNVGDGFTKEPTLPISDIDPGLERRMRLHVTVLLPTHQKRGSPQCAWAAKLILHPTASRPSVDHDHDQRSEAGVVVVVVVVVVALRTP